jgi:signal transduction histidine kinase
LKEDDRRNGGSATVLIFAIVPLVLGTAGWVGWLTERTVLASVRTEFIPMAPNTATCFLLTSIGVLALSRRRKKSFVSVLLGLSLVMSGVRLIEILLGFQTSIEHFLWSAPQRTLGMAPLGEMALATAWAFVILILALWRLNQHPGFDLPASALSSMSLSIGLIFSLGYLYGSPLLYGTTTIPMALTTAVSFVFASAAALAENSFRYVETQQKAEKRKQELAEAARESADNFRSLVDNNPNGLLVVGSNRERLFSNPAAEEFLTQPQRESLDYLPESDCEIVLDDERFFYVTIHPVEWRGSQARLYSIKNTTDLRRSEKKVQELEKQFMHSQKMEALGRLAGGVAHDFNNLLTAIMGYATVLKESQVGPHEELDEILKASERASDLSHRLLALSRSHALEAKTLDLKERVRQTETLLRRLLRPEIEFHSELGDSSPAWVSAVPSAIEQVVLNLVVNAQDAVEGRGRITLEIDQVELDHAYAGSHFQIQPGSYVLLKVSDSGTGIAPEHLPHIFEPYYTTKEKGKGTGLGLSTIYGIVQQSNGSIYVYSVPGRGSTFKVYLPLVEPPEATQLNLQAASPTPKRSMQILLVDDEQSIQMLATRLLERAGHKVACCDSAEDALTLLQEGTAYDLLVTDMILPGQSGLELVCQVPRGLPAILMSGYSEQGLPDREKVLERVVFLEKPFSLAQFESKVDEAVCL